MEPRVWIVNRTGNADDTMVYVDGTLIDPAAISQVTVDLTAGSLATAAVKFTDVGVDLRAKADA